MVGISNSGISDKSMSGPFISSGSLLSFGLPDFEIDGLSGGLPAGVTFTRASGATRVNHRGYIEEVGANAARFTYDPTLTYNELPDPWFDAFTVGAPPPATCLVGGAGAVWTQSVVVKGLTADGLPFVEIEATGTPANTNGFGLIIGGTPGAGMPAWPGDTVSGWLRTAVVSYSGPTPTSGFPRIDFGGATNTFFTADRSVVLGSLVVGTEYTVTATRTLSNGSVTQAGWMVNATGVSVVGTPVTIRYRVVFPVVNRGAAPITDTVSPQTLAARRNETPQYGLLGLLLEEGSTNHIANPRLEGAVAGTPGTGPSSLGFLSADGAHGLTRTISLSMEAGVQTVSIRWSGTATATNSLFLAMIPSSVAAAAGQAWTFSVRATVSGPNPPASVFSRITEVGASPFTAGDAAIPVGAAPIITSRHVHTRVLTNAATTGVQATILASVISGAAYDFTIRFALPQLEQSPIPSSPILPPVGSPAVSSRARDNLTLPLMLPNLSRGTVVTRGQRTGPQPVPTAKYGPGLNSNSTFNGVFALFWAGNQTRPSVQINSGGTFQAGRQAPAGTAGAAYTGAVAWGDGSALMSFDGEPAVLDAAAASPATFLAARGNGLDNATATGTADFILCFFRVWNRKLTSAQVQQQSARAT